MLLPMGLMLQVILIQTPQTGKSEIPGWTNMVQLWNRGSYWDTFSQDMKIWHLILTLLIQNGWNQQPKSFLHLSIPRIPHIENKTYNVMISCQRLTFSRIFFFKNPHLIFLYVCVWIGLIMVLYMLMYILIFMGK